MKIKKQKLSPFEKRIWNLATRFGLPDDDDWQLMCEQRKYSVSFINFETERGTSVKVIFSRFERDGTITILREQVFT